MSGDPRSWLDRAVGVCLAILVGAVALFVAIRLIEAVATALLIILGAALLVAIGIAVLRARNRGW